MEVTVEELRTLLDELETQITARIFSDVESYINTKFLNNKQKKYVVVEDIRIRITALLKRPDIKEKLNNGALSYKMIMEELGFVAKNRKEKIHFGRQISQVMSDLGYTSKCTTRSGQQGRFYFKIV